ncbi:MAG: TlpA family protein disulfide reductase [Planctomycetota bacterium]|nr:TlpA family protein disulfide reductase [Planctomycetota bacterium]
MFTLRSAAFALVLLAAPLGAGEVKVGDKAPEIKVKDWFNSKGESLAALKDKIAIVEFWATWCGPCKTSIPHLVKLHEKYKEQGVVIMGLTDEPKEKVAAFVKQLKMTYPVGAGSASGADYGIETIPNAFIVVSGQVVWAGNPLNGLDAALEKVIGSVGQARAQLEAEGDLAKRLEQAKALAAQNQPGKALSILETMVASNKEPSPNLDAANQGIAELGAAGKKELDAALAKEPLEAQAALRAAAERWAGSKLGDEAKAHLAKLVATGEFKEAHTEARHDQQAKDLLAAAHAALERSDWGRALGLYEKLAHDFADTDEGKLAARKAAELKQDKKLIANLGSETEAKEQMVAAKAFIKYKALDEARAKLQEIVKDYPETETAKEAKVLLNDL